MEYWHHSSTQKTPTQSLHSSAMIESDEVTSSFEIIEPSAGVDADVPTSTRFAPQTPWLQFDIGRGLWIWEILGVALSLGCIISLLILLHYLDQSSLAKWQFVMAPNTTISALITISKTSMLLAVAAGISQLKWVHFAFTKRQISDLDIFDEASRGPWGAFNFILRMKRRSALASVGAFVVVVSLAMEPFAQQILSFETRSVASPIASAYAPIAHAYDDPVSNEMARIINPRFRAAFMMGILRSPFQWPLQCSTGNCSWPAFSTLGICTSCTNVTSSSQEQVVMDQAVNTSNGEWGTDIHTIHYTTPTGLKLTVSPGGIIYSGTSSTVRSSSLVTSTAVESQAWDQRLRDPVIAVAAIAISFKPGPTTKEDDRLEGGYRYYYAPPDITECSINWCAKQYKNLEVVNGLMVSPSVKSVQIPSQNPTNDESYYSNRDFHYTLPTDINANGEESTELTVSCNNHVAMSKFLVNHLNFTVFQGERSGDNDGASTYIGPMLLSRPNATALFEDITDSLTNHIQTGPNSTLHNGTASISEIYVIVRWPWVILPALVAIIGAIFLAVIIFVNRGSNVHLWKASLKPLLFHGLDGWELDEVDPDNVREMENLAKRMKTQLARNEEGRLVLTRSED